MSKKRKTRSQKLLADQRHVLYHLDVSPAQTITPAEKKPTFKPTIASYTPQTTSYSYVIDDIKKTFLITGSILTMQVILFFLMKEI